MKRTRGSSRTRTPARIIPANGSMPTRPRDYQDPSQLPHVRGVTAQDGFTVVLPIVPADTADSTTTQLLPRVPMQRMLPASAQHANPAAWRDRTHVEDEWPDVPAPTSRARHVLAQLRSVPDVPPEIADAPKRIIAALGGFEPASTRPDRRLAVRLFRAARDMARIRRRWCDEADARLRAQDARIAEFARRWQHDDAHWERVAEALKAKQDASDAGQIIKAYDEGGTQLALCTVDEVAHEIARRALAGSAGSR
jgi:hypothetical protein